VLIPAKLDALKDKKGDYYFLPPLCMERGLLLY